MFCNKPKNVNKNLPGKKNKKRKKKSTHLQGCNKLRNAPQNNLNIARAMSSWAENYTAATTWQLQHQIAYWKSRAVALKYENKVLHDMIKEQHFKQPVRATHNVVASDSSECNEEMESDHEDEGNQRKENDDDVNDYEEEDDDNDDLEVSEEFIEFLKQNAKYKEDARKEKERLTAQRQEDSLNEDIQEKKFQSSEEKQARFCKLYGDDWEKIMALETSMMCKFINECDQQQPEYWPNIPFNFVVG